MTFPDRSSERVDVAPEGTEVERTLSFPPGDSAVLGYVRLVGWRLMPSP
jgi:hypothetical protein